MPGQAVEPPPPDCLLAVPKPTADRRPPSLEALERNYILAVLRQTGWVITGPRQYPRNRMKKLRFTRASHHPW